MKIHGPEKTRYVEQCRLIRGRAFPGILTPAEMEVLKFLYAGLLYKQIALRRDTTFQAVKNDVWRIHKKLGLSRLPLRVNIVLEALRRALIYLDTPVMVD